MKELSLLLFITKEGKWIGAKIGLYVISSNDSGIRGFTDFDWFRTE